jgi:hypothetical protein
MSGRREFLKQAGAFASVPWMPSQLAIPHQESGGHVHAPGLEWEFSDGQINIKQGEHRLLTALYPGYQHDGIWQLGESLVVEHSHATYADKIGHGHAIEIACRLGLLEGSLRLVNYEDGHLGCRLSLTNNTGNPIVLQTCSPLMTHFRNGSVSLVGHPAEWRVYVDSGGCGGKCASYGINENEGHNVAGGVSVLWSPEGNQSLAIGQVEVERSWTEIVYDFGEKGLSNQKYHWAQAKNLRLRLEQDATGYQLDSGETFDLDHCLLIFDPDPFRVLTDFSDAMVAFNNVRKFTNDDVWVGWMTWYNQEYHLRGAFGATGETCASAAVTLEQSRFIVDSGLHRYGVRDIEIDDGYQKNLHLGDWLETTSMFPSGMSGVAKDLLNLGMRPGVWLTPFVATEDSVVFREHPEWFVRHAEDWYHAGPPVQMWEFDPTAPGALDWLIEVFQTFRRWGYWAFKNDFSGGLSSSHGKQYHNRKQTGLMRWRWTWRRIREALGGDGACHLQLCSGNNVGSLGIVDSVRTGEDVIPCVVEGAPYMGEDQDSWMIIREDTATTGINRWWQNKRFFICDPDNLEVAEYKDYRLYRDTVEFASKLALSFDEARVRATLVVAVGGNIMLGDRLTLLEPERIAIIKKTLPLYGESAVPLDMFEQTVPTLWWHHISRPWGSWEVLSVVNFGEASLVKEIPLQKMKVPLDQAVVVWELWSEKEHTNIGDGLLRVAVKPHSVKTLRITPVRKDRATLVGSSFHITMGAVEVADLTHGSDGGLRLRVSRPADEQGVCAFWSPKQRAVTCIPVKTGPEGVELQVS